MKKIILGVAGMALATVTSVSAAAPALAASYSHVDARHDVDRSTKPEGTPYRRAMLNRETDVTRFHIVNDKSKIRVGITLRSSSLTGLRWRDVLLYLNTDGDRYSTGWFQRHAGNQFGLSDETTQKNLTCSSERAGRHGRTIWLSLNRSCVGSPRWIRVAASVGSYDGHRYFADNALSGNFRHIFPDVYSPRVRAS